MKEHNDWIAGNIKSPEEAFAKCAEITTKMADAFPDLKRIRGQVLLSNGWYRNHWWLEDSEGGIIDPSASQFSLDYFGNARALAYYPHDESQPEPTGKCPNCGGLCYNEETCCSRECAAAYVSYCNNQIRI